MSIGLRQLKNNEEYKFINIYLAKIMELVSCHQGNLNCSNNDGDTPLILAVMDGSLEVVKQLVDMGADINLSDKDGYTPLMYAVFERYEDIATYLIKSGARVDLKNDDGDDALTIAESLGLLGLSELIEKAVKNKNQMQSISKRHSSGWPRTIEQYLNKALDSQLFNH